MASLRDTVKDYQDELRDGIAWVAFWKQGRSWNAEYFHLDSSLRCRANLPCVKPPSAYGSADAAFVVT